MRLCLRRQYHQRLTIHYHQRQTRRHRRHRHVRQIVGHLCRRYCPVMAMRLGYCQSHLTRCHTRHHHQNRRCVLPVLNLCRRYHRRHRQK